jgi:hypothetical protein
MSDREPTESVTFFFSKIKTKVTEATKDTVEETIWTWSESGTGDTVDPAALDGGANAAVYDGGVRLIGPSDALAPSDFFLI